MENLKQTDWGKEDTNYFERASQFGCSMSHRYGSRKAHEMTHNFWVISSSNLEYPCKAFWNFSSTRSKYFSSLSRFNLRKNKRSSGSFSHSLIKLNFDWLISNLVRIGAFENFRSWNKCAKILQQTTLLRQNFIFQNSQMADTDWLI